MSRQPWTPAEDRRLRALAKTQRCRRIADLMGRTEFSVYHRVKALGLSLRKNGDAHWNTIHSEAYVELARTLHEEGHAPSRIRERLGINKGTLDGILYYGHRLGN